MSKLTFWLFQLWFWRNSFSSLSSRCRPRCLVDCWRSSYCSCWLHILILILLICRYMWWNHMALKRSLRWVFHEILWSREWLNSGLCPYFSFYYLNQWCLLWNHCRSLSRSKRLLIRIIFCSIFFFSCLKILWIRYFLYILIWVENFKQFPVGGIPGGGGGAFFFSSGSGVGSGAAWPAISNNFDWTLVAFGLL